VVWSAIDKPPSQPSTLLTILSIRNRPTVQARAVNQLFGSLPRPGEVSEKRERRGRDTVESGYSPASGARPAPRKLLPRNGVIWAHSEPQIERSQVNPLGGDLGP